jgi:putative ABC transport system permease protein
LVGDLRYALRLLAKSPGFTLFAVLALALGIGANTAIFSVVNAVLLRPLPYPHAEQLVSVANTVHDKRLVLSLLDVRDYREQSGAFSALAATMEFPGNLTGGARPERIEALCVTGEYFSLLGVPAQAGRTFVPADVVSGIGPVTVISDALWRRRFGARPDTLGSRVTFDDDPYTIVGVMPPGFRHPDSASGVPVDVWVPCSFQGMPFAATLRRTDRSLGAIGRLRPDVDLAQASARVAAVAARVRRENPVDYPEAERWGTRVAPLATQVVGDVGHALLLLFGAVGLVLLIACTNVAILIMARAAARRKEVTVRAALGASRARLVRQLLTESLVLSLAGGTLGVLVAMWATDFLVSLSPSALPRAHEIRLDGLVLGFTAGLSCVTAVLFGLAPAIRASHADLTTVLNEGGRGMHASPGSRLRTGLVVAQVALSMVVLAVAGLLLRSLHNTQKVEPGFDARNLATVDIWMPVPNDRNIGYYNIPAYKVTFADTLAQRVRALPGVTDAAVAAALPFDRRNAGALPPIAVVGRDEPPGSHFAVVTLVGEGYFGTMGIPVASGRSFARRDDLEAPKVAVVNRAAAAHLWPGANPVGARILIGPAQKPEDAFTVIGIVGDVRSLGLDAEIPDEIYLAFAQIPVPRVHLVARTQPGATAAVAQIPDVVRSIDPNLPVSAVRPVADLLAEAIAQRRFTALLLVIFGAVALAMAALGIYSVTSYAVAQRRHEFGVRMAVGARGGDVIAMVLREALLVVAAGVGVGLVGALLAARAFTRLLYGVSASDPLTYVAIGALLGGIALVASVVPARRAARVDPMIALRSET